MRNNKSGKVIAIVLVVLLLLSIIVPTTIMTFYGGSAVFSEDSAVCMCVKECEKLFYELTTGISSKTHGNAPVYLDMICLYVYVEKKRVVPALKRYNRR